MFEGSSKAAATSFVTVSYSVPFSSAGNVVVFFSLPWDGRRKVKSLIMDLDLFFEESLWDEKKTKLRY